MSARIALRQDIFTKYGLVKFIAALIPFTWCVYGL
ncbi:hypothetical protein COCOBI_pt-0720 (chloroplast) [Coccomyxa sp. Obi]|nr:hypothetical protein COCOBI_pt-0720 [Coccomyxa sp. Obi]